MWVGNDGFYMTGADFSGHGWMRVDGTCFIGAGSRFLSTDATLYLFGSTSLSTGFHHHNGLVTLFTGTDFTGGNAILSKFEIDSSRETLFVRVNETCWINDGFYLHAGNLKTGTDATIHLLGDLSCARNFGLRDARNDMIISMDSTVYQRVTNERGGIIPGLYVDKTVTDPVKCWGTGPVILNRDFVIHDGTFDFNGLDMYVGIYL
jgi:hypothetical protein